MPYSDVDSQVYDLLIVGAGPVGLLFALGAYARGCRNIAVIDQTSAFRRAGELLDLQPNGIIALRTIAPTVADSIRARQRAPSGKPLPMLDVDGRFVDGYKTRDVTGETSASLLWSDLQEALLDAMPEEVEIIVNLQLLNLEFVSVRGREGEDEELVRADCLENRIRVNPFVNWENDPAAAREVTNGFANNIKDRSKSLFAKFVIGADGINSVCRAVVYMNIGGAEWERAANAEYAGFMSFKGKGSLGDAHESLGPEIERYFQGGSVAAIGCREEDCKLGWPKVMVAHLTEVARVRLGFEWIFVIHLAAVERLAKRSPELGGHAALQEHALATLREAHFPESVQSMARILLAETDDDHFVVARPLYIVPVDHPAPFERLPTAGEAPVFPENFYRPFGYRRIFLAGDSLHGGPPTIAQGTSMGFEDCCELIDTLAEAHGWGSGNECYPGQVALDRALTKYKDARLERLSKVQRLSVNKTAFQKTDENAANWKELSNFVPVAKGW